MKAYQKELTEDEYEDILTDIYGTVSICGMEYDSGRALYKLDPVAFRCGMSDYEPDIWCCSECEGEHDEEDSAEECCQEDSEDNDEE